MSDTPQPEPYPTEPAPAPEPPPPAAKSEEEIKAEREARIAATRGAQVVLEPDSLIALAAKGGLHATMQGNVEARDAALIEAGLDPAAPSAHLTDPPPPKPAA